MGGVMMFSDTEHRILLSAMEREMKICKQVDSELYREPYEISLVDVCRSINRKIHDIQHKYAWHDLRKNPDDLPKNVEMVLCEWTDGGSHYWHDVLVFWAVPIRHFTNESGLIISVVGDEIISCGGHVVAWRYIEPFEEE